MGDMAELIFAWTFMGGRKLALYHVESESEDSDGEDMMEELGLGGAKEESAGHSSEEEEEKPSLMPTKEEDSSSDEQMDDESGSEEEEDEPAKPSKAQKVEIKSSSSQEMKRQIVPSVSAESEQESSDEDSQADADAALETESEEESEDEPLGKIKFEYIPPSSFAACFPHICTFHGQPRCTLYILTNW